MLDEKIIKRFWAKVDKSNPPCWVWKGAHDKYHGRIRVSKKKILNANRVSYEIHFGEITGDKSCVMHICTNYLCINPDHLKLGTRGEVTRRMVSLRLHGCSKKTHCKNGHEFTKESIFASVKGWRRCKACSKQKYRGKNAKDN